MAQVIEGNPSIAGRIGKGFGQGLAEQLPKELERSRLSHGLRTLGQTDYTGKNRLEMAADLAAIPGMTPELMSFAQQQLVNKNFADQTKRKPEPSPKPNEAISGQPRENAEATSKPNIEVPLKERGLAAPAQIRQYQQGRLQTPSQEDINSLASDYLNSGYANDINHAQQMAAQALQQNITAQNERIGAFRSGLTNRMQLDLEEQGLGDYQDLLGKVQQDLLDQGELLISQGATPQAAEKEVQDIMRDIALATTQTQNTGAQSIWSTSADEKITALKNQKKIYDKYGYGEQFNDVAQHALGSTPLYAANALEPLQNETVKKELKGLKEPTFGQGKLSAKKLDEIIENIKPNDNLLSIAYELRNKRYNVNQFIERLQQLEGKKFFPTEQQGRQLTKPINNQFYGDILLRLSPLIPRPS